MDIIDKKLPLYRAKVKEGLNKGKWVYGIPYKLHGILYMFPLSNTFVSKEVGDIVFGDYYVINPATLGRYAGQHDRSGRKIFEGDVIRIREWLKGYNDNYEPITYERIETVKFDENTFSFYPFNVHIYDETMDAIFRPFNDNIFVIGNIFDKSLGEGRER